MQPELLYELIRTGQNRPLTIRTTSTQREQAALALVRAGYLIPVDEAHHPDFDPARLATVYDATLTLTVRGRAFLLALDSADFETRQDWPLSRDIRQVQARLARRE